MYAAGRRPSISPEHLLRAFTPRVAQRVTARRGNRIDDRATQHAESQRPRKLIEEAFGWGKAVGLLRELRHRGLGLVDRWFTFTMGVYNLVRMGTPTGAGLCA